MSMYTDDVNVSSPLENLLSRLLRVRMTLRDVLYISYAVPPGRMRALVPDILPLATAGDDMAFVSIVFLQSTQVRSGLLPFTSFNYCQLNVRTYVIDPVSGKNAVYFLRSGVTSRFISLVTRMSGIPWQLIELRTKVDPHKETKYYTATGNWDGSFSLRSQAFSDKPKRPAFFENKESAVDFLIRPLTGFIDNKQRLGRFVIQHPEVDPETWILTELDFPLFTNLGVVDEVESPHSVFFLPAADFSIYLPPRKI
jgi:hypothetical protein